MSTNKNISLIIVNYNSSHNTTKLIKSINLIDNLIKKVIIVDNNSNDLKKLKIYKKNILLIKNDKNLGFAKAVNIGIKKANTKYILLLNPDTLIIDSSIRKLYKEIESDSKIGAIGGKIQNMTNQKYQFTATTKPNFLTGIFEFTNFKKLFPRNIFSKKFWVESDKEITKPLEVGSLCGAFILFKRKLGLDLNLFNESYFLYMEDIDFGLSIIEKGYKVIFDPNSKIKHIGGASSNSKYNIVLKHWYDSRKIFFNKYCNRIQSVILNIIFLIEENSLKIYHHIKNEPKE